MMEKICVGGKFECVTRFSRLESEPANAPLLTWRRKYRNVNGICVNSAAGVAAAGVSINNEAELRNRICVGWQNSLKKLHCRAGSVRIMSWRFAGPRQNRIASGSVGNDGNIATCKTVTHLRTCLRSCAAASAWPRRAERRCADASPDAMADTYM